MHVASVVFCIGPLLAPSHRGSGVVVVVVVVVDFSVAFKCECRYHRVGEMSESPPVSGVA